MCICVCVGERARKSEKERKSENIERVREVKIIGIIQAEDKLRNGQA